MIIYTLFVLSISFFLNYRYNNNSDILLYHASRNKRTVSFHVLLMYLHVPSDYYNISLSHQTSNPRTPSSLLLYVHAIKSFASRSSDRIQREFRHIVRNHILCLYHSNICICPISTGSVLAKNSFARLRSILHHSFIKIF